MFRILGTVVGFVLFRFIGALIGYFIGKFVDDFKKPKSNYIHKEQVSPADFELNLLSLCAIVIKADGTVTKQEMDFVQTYFVQQFGKERANSTFRTFNEIVKNRDISAVSISQYLRIRTRYETRLQIIHFLFNLAQSDGNVSVPELHKILEISGYLAVQHRDFESIKAMFFKNPDSAYKILEIDKNASVEEIKSAYRTMAKKYHPDKLQHMDEAYRKGAEEKFRKVQEAYEQIQKERKF